MSIAIQRTVCVYLFVNSASFNGNLGNVDIRILSIFSLTKQW